MRYPDVMHRPLWISGEPRRYTRLRAGRPLLPLMARERTDRTHSRAQIEADGTKLACLFLQRDRCYLVKTGW
jgi:hypothetical protein